MTTAEQMALFATDASFESLSEPVVRELKIRILDSLGCALAAMGELPMNMLGGHLCDVGGAAHATCLGRERVTVDRAAAYNGALISHWNFHDCYMTEAQSCHPCDSLAPIMATAEYAEASGQTALVALAVAYQIHCRLCDEAPLRARGFDHSLLSAFAAAAGAARALGLDTAQTAHALALSGAASMPLRVIRTRPLSMWTTLASSYAASRAVEAALLARRGVTGPLHIFEGKKGVFEMISKAFEVDWAVEPLDRVMRTSIRKYPTAIHTQTAIEAIVELTSGYRFEAEDVEFIDIEIFKLGFQTTGGGDENAKMKISCAQEAAQSLPYLAAVAVLDREVTLAQLSRERIRGRDVQELMHRVEVRPDEQFSLRAPQEMGCRVQLMLSDGSTLQGVKKDFPGFPSRPLNWEMAVEKFARLSQGLADARLREDIVQAVQALDSIPILDLTDLFRRVPSPSTRNNPG